MKIKFHCDEETGFNRADQFVRAFTYENYSISPHNHDFYEINIVISGKGVHQIENYTLNVERGDVFVIPPLISHAYYNTDSLKVCHIIIKNKFIRGNQKESNKVRGYVQLMEIEPLLRQNNNDTLFLHLDATQLSELQYELRYLEDSGIFNQNSYSAIQGHSVWKLIYYLSYLYDKQINEKIKKKEAKFNVQILDTLEYLHMHFPERMTIEMLAERVFLSRSTFLRNFKISCGCTPGQYLNRYRVTKAKELLENSKLSKTEVAHFCGFYDLSHMERSIKNAGISISVRK